MTHVTHPSDQAPSDPALSESVVPPTVIAEVCYLLHERAGPPAEVQFLGAFGTGELRLASLNDADIARMAQLCDQYADLGLGGADAFLVAMRSEPVTRTNALYGP